jgi:hypothetical protein
MEAAGVVECCGGDHAVVAAVEQQFPCHETSSIVRTNATTRILKVHSPRKTEIWVYSLGVFP